MRLTWRRLRDLADEHGDAFHILDVRRYERNVLELRDAFRRHYPRTAVACSYKTNHTPRLCRAANETGAYAEVVSREEYELAIQLDVNPRRIIVNGPMKTEDDVATALLAGAVVNLDAHREVEIVKKLAAAHPEAAFSVGLRCAIDMEEETLSRFGFDAEGGALEAALAELRTSRNCRISGLHCHYSVPRSPESHARRARIMLELARRHFPIEPPSFIDLGGGLFGKMADSLIRQLPWNVATYQNYAESIGPLFAAAFPDDSAPELILEPGSGLTHDVMRFAAVVIDVKTVRGRSLALVAGTMYDVKPMQNQWNLPMTVLRNPNRESGAVVPGPVDVVGHTCVERDVLQRRHPDEIGVGDFVVFGDVGAYTTVLRPPFIRPAPAILAYDANVDRFEVAKRRGTFKDMFGAYEINGDDK